MKKEFTRPEMEVIRFDSADVIVASGGGSPFTESTEPLGEPGSGNDGPTIIFPGGGIH